MSENYKLEQLKALCNCQFCTKLLVKPITLPCDNSSSRYGTKLQTKKTETLKIVCYFVFQVMNKPNVFFLIFLIKFFTVES